MSDAPEPAPAPRSLIPEDLVEHLNRRLEALNGAVDHTSDIVISHLGWDRLGHALTVFDPDMVEPVTGMPAAAADEAAEVLTRYLDGHPELTNAFAVFTDVVNGLRDDWAAGVYPYAQAAVDRWVADVDPTGLAPTPKLVDGDLVAVDVTTAKTRWRQPFTQELDGTLTRGFNSDDMWMDDTTCALRVAGTHLDVWLTADRTRRSTGEADDATSGDQATRSRRRLTGTAIAVASDPTRLGFSAALDHEDGDYGPFLIETSEMPADSADGYVTVNAFDISCDVDLIETVAGAAALAARGLRGIWPEPAGISAIRSCVRARFDAMGFEAAATTYASILSGVPAFVSRRHVTGTFTYTVGFACVDPTTGLVVCAGHSTPATIDQ